jgi:sulfur carrier protein
MSHVIVNGEARQVRDDASVADVVDLVSTTRKGVAVALEGDIVPKSQWEATFVSSGARIEIVTAAAGG